MLACKRVNLTVSHSEYPENIFGSFDSTRKTFMGRYAENFLDNYFLKRKHETQEEVLKYCTFRKFEEEGRMLPNGSWTGAIADVIARKSDVTLRMQDRFIKPGLVEFSNTWGSEDIVVGHYIDEKPKNWPIINFEAIWNILVPSAWFLLEYLSMFAFSLAFAYLLGRCLKKRGGAFVLDFASNLFTQTSRIFQRCSAVGLFFLCNLVFLFLVQQILSNNVKTDKVIVSDEPILDTLEKLQQANKEICFPLQEDIDRVLYSDFVEKQPSYKLIYSKINQEQPCCLFKYRSNLKGLSEKDFFMLNGEAFMNSLKMFNPFVGRDIFISDRPFGTVYIVFYLSKSINKLAKAEFNRQLYIYFEGGYKKKSFREADRLIDKQVPPIKNTFRNAEAYIQHYTMTSDVQMNDFSFVYLFYGFWLLCC